MFVFELTNKMNKYWLFWYLVFDPSLDGTELDSRMNRLFNEERKIVKKSHKQVIHYNDNEMTGEHKQNQLTDAIIRKP